MQQPRPTTLTDFVPLQKLGVGSFSTVYKVRRVSDSKIYALKKVKLGMLKDKEKQNAVNEIRILASLTSPYVIGYKEALFEQKHNVLCIVMEYADGGDLQKIIEKAAKQKTPIPEKEIWRATVHILKGLDVLHSNNILHRDLKSANIFLSSKIYKLGDLNVSKIKKEQMANTQTGTPYYASPEVWNDKPYDHKSDIWSLGCIVYEMCTLEPPFQGNNMEELNKSIQRCRYKRIPNMYSKALEEIIGLCLQKNPILRPSAKQFLNHSLLKNRLQEFTGQHESSRGQLLGTIRVPMNPKEFHQSLPKAKYQIVNENEKVDDQQKRVKEKQRQQQIQKQKEKQIQKQKEKQRQKQTQEQQRKYKQIMKYKQRQKQQQIQKSRQKQNRLQKQKQISHEKQRQYESQPDKQPSLLNNFITPLKSKQSIRLSQMISNDKSSYTYARPVIYSDRVNTTENKVSRSESMNRYKQIQKSLIVQSSEIEQYLRSKQKERQRDREREKSKPANSMPRTQRQIQSSNLNNPSPLVSRPESKRLIDQFDRLVPASDHKILHPLRQLQQPERGYYSANKSPQRIESRQKQRISERQNINYNNQIEGREVSPLLKRLELNYQLSKMKELKSRYVVNTERKPVMNKLEARLQKYSYPQKLGENKKYNVMPSWW